MISTGGDLSFKNWICSLDQRVDPKIKYVHVSSFSDDLLNAYIQTEGRASALSNLNHYTNCFEGYVRTIVSEVKRSLTQPQPTLQIDLKSLQLNHFPEAHFECVIRNLYQQYGIIVKTADQRFSPTMIEVVCGLDNRNINPLLSNNLMAHRKEGKFCDFTIRNSDAPGTAFPCHKVILSAGSPFFERYFSGNFAESETTAEYTLPRSLTDYEPFTTRQVETVLDYIYSGQIKLDNLSSIELFQFLELASYFSLTSLREECIELLGSKIDADNVQEIYQLAVRLNVQDLLDYCFLELKAEGVCVLLNAAIDQGNTEVSSQCLSYMMGLIHRDRNNGQYRTRYQDCIWYAYGPMLGPKGVFEVLKLAIQEKNEELNDACAVYLNSELNQSYKGYDKILPIAEELAKMGQPSLLEACQKFRETHSDADENPDNTDEEGTEKL